MDVRAKLAQMFQEVIDPSDQYALREPVIQKEYLVNGELREWQGDFLEVRSPICEKKGDHFERKRIGAFPQLTEKEAQEALQAAVDAYQNGCGVWPTMTVEERIECVEQFLFEMLEAKQFIVTMIMWEIGKSVDDAVTEFDRTVAYIRDTIEALKELDRQSSRFVKESGIMAQIRRAPFGVVLCMGPFNYPLNETFTTLIPALIMGNVIVFKPPKLGVLLYQPLLKAFQKAFPAGVVNTVYGRGAKVVGPLMETGRIDSLAFIGTSKVADVLKHQHPKPHRLKCILGLDAKNPAIIMEDADMDLAVRESLLGTLSFNGQRCTAIKMLFVHQSIAPEFIQRLSAGIREMNIGMPWEPEVKITPLPENNKTADLTKLVEDALRHGAQVVNEFGGTVKETFFYPAVLFPVNEHMKAYQVEQFGPVIPIVPFSEIETPLHYIIESNFGQQVSIFCRDPYRIATLVDQLVNQVCRVNINSQCQRGPDILPFNGRKDSAEGTLSVSDALRAFTIRTLVAAKENNTNKEIIRTILKDDLSSFISTDFIL
ncbi:MAG: NADP-dependent glyceraldehyde-3-phosphate dehydrogenase [Peptococcaceae bacterium]|jgi:glyceraldehyde-3-phosphate dehydrogenase (NADP+)|nr:NADP-dependent glyceraldehyde-3-phosphate dehydrogenase [Peptococcaceae bacterium]